MTTTTETLLSVREVAKRLDVTTRTVRNYIKSGTLEARRVGPRLLRVTESAVAGFQRSNSKPA